MTQIATVTRLLGDGLAEVWVKRKTACGHDCADCAGCEPMVGKTEMTAPAINRAGAAPGDLVVVENETAGVLGAAAAIYLVPFVLFFVGYFAAGLLWPGGASSAIGGVVCFTLGFLPALMLNRSVGKTKALRLTIVEIKHPCSGM